MHLHVQKFTRTTWAQSLAGPSGSGLSHSVAPPRWACARARPRVLLAQRPERVADVFGEQLRLLPGGEVPASVVLGVGDEVGVRLLGPAPRDSVELVGEGAHADRDLDALDREEGELVSQYSRTEDTPVLVSQNSVMLSR